MPAATRRSIGRRPGRAANARGRRPGASPSPGRAAPGTRRRSAAGWRPPGCALGVHQAASGRRTRRCRRRPSSVRTGSSSRGQSTSESSTPAISLPPNSGAGARTVEASTRASGSMPGADDVAGVDVEEPHLVAVAHVDQTADLEARRCDPIGPTRPRTVPVAVSREHHRADEHHLLDRRRGAAGGHRHQARRCRVGVRRWAAATARGNGTGSSSAVADEPDQGASASTDIVAANATSARSVTWMPHDAQRY